MTEPGIAERAIQGHRFFKGILRALDVVFSTEQESVERVGRGIERCQVETLGERGLSLWDSAETEFQLHDSCPGKTKPWIKRGCTLGGLQGTREVRLGLAIIGFRDP